MESPPRQQTIVTGSLRLLGSLAAQPVLRRAWTFGVVALLGIIVTAMFVRNYSNPMIPDELHRHGGKFEGTHLSGLNAKNWARYPDMIAGTAHKPYVTRALLPFVVRHVEPLVPDLGAITDSPRFALTLEEVGLDWEPEHYRIYLVGVGFMYLFLLGWVAGLRALCRAVYDVPTWVVDLVGLAGLLVLPPFFELYGSYLYDFPTICLFTWGLWALARERWVAFFVLYAIGTLNKETTVLLTFAFCMVHAFSGRLSWKTYFGLALAQSVLFVAIRFGLGHVFADNPGVTTEFHLLRNLSKLPRWDFGTLAAMGLALGLVLWRWPEKSLFLRASLIMLVPLLILAFLFGYFDEMRGYYETLSLVLLLMADSLFRLFAVPFTLRT